MDTADHRTRDGVDLATRHWPAAGDPTLTMLVVHGVSEHSGRWDHVGTFFADAGYDVHAYDLRGHGQSGGARLDLERFDQHVDDLAEMIAAVRGDRPLVVYAHSMGGLIATLHAESDHPQPDCYVLSAPALAADVALPLRVGVAVVSRVAPGVRLDAGLKGHQLSRDPAVGEAYFADPLVTVKGTARFGKQLLDAMPRATAGVGVIGTPALVIHGGDDTVVPVSASAPLAAVPGVERRVWPGLRHEMHNEPEQAEILAFVRAWLDDRLRSGTG